MSQMDKVIARAILEGINVNKNVMTITEMKIQND